MIHTDEIIMLFGTTPPKPKAPTVAGVPDPPRSAAGQRNRAMFEWACALRACGLDRTEIHTEIDRANDWCCTPPLTAREISDLARSASRYPAGERREWRAERDVRRALGARP